MSENKDKFIRIRDKEAKEMFEALKVHHGRKDGEMAVTLIRKEYARLFSQPRSDVLISEAMQLDETTVFAD